MAKIVPIGMEDAVESSPLSVDETKKTALVAKAKELLNGNILEEKVLMDQLEQYYVSLNEHYTSKQLKEVINQVKIDLTPEPEEK